MSLAPTRRRAAAAVESLEGRRLLAATASLAWDGTGLLSINGSEGREALVISAKDNTLSVAGTTGSAVSYGPTLVNASAKPFTVPLWDVKSIFVTLGGGNDSLTIDLPEGGIGGTVDLGAGNDQFVAGNSSLGTIRILGGDGNDYVSLYNTIASNLIVETGADQDTISLADSRVWGYASIDAGAGNDHVLVNRTSIYGFAYINGGDGIDDIQGEGNLYASGSYIPGFEGGAFYSPVV